MVIPNYNHARYLARRIESVLHQSVLDLEVILLDDCSSDHSRSIMEEYAVRDSRIRLVFNEQNSGSTFKQWNKGMSLARGEYIWLAESDDYAELTLLETLLAPLDADAQVGLAYCDSWHVFDDRDAIEASYYPYEELDPALWRNDFVVDGATLIRQFMPYRNVIPNASAVVFRRRVAQQVGPANETLKLVGDWLYWTSIFAVSKVAFVAQRLNYIRHHVRNVRSKSAVKGANILELTFLIAEIRRYSAIDEFTYDRAVRDVTTTWLRSIAAHKIPLATNLKILKNLFSLGARARHITTYELKSFLAANQYAGLKQLARSAF